MQYEYGSLSHSPIDTNISVQAVIRLDGNAGKVDKNRY